MHIPAVENQTTIAAWASATFGEPPTEVRLLGQLNSELAELVREVTGLARPSEIAEECADVAIILCRIADRRGFPVELSGALADTQAAVVAMLMRLSEVQMTVPALQEMSGIVHASLSDEPALMPPRVCQLMFIMAALCWKQGTTLHREVQAKMAVNRGRKWAAEDGAGYHVREVA